MNNEELRVTIGRNLQNLRSDRGLTQEKLAENVRISTSFCANIERGKKGASIRVLRDIAKSLGVSVDYLINEEHSNSCIQNIETLLRDRPEEFIISMEKLIRLCIEEFSE